MPLSSDLLVGNLLSPVVLAFVLGLVSRALRSDLSIPAAIQSYLSIFLLLSIGMKGGVALHQTSLGEVVVLLGITLGAGVATAASAFVLARRWLRDERTEAAALAAHYGSVSAVTFIAAQQFVERSGTSPEGVLVALVVALEIPAILIGLALAKGAGGVRVAVNGAGACVFRQADMEKALAANWSANAVAGISQSAEGLNSDIHGSAEYRAHLVGVMAKRAMAAAG